MKNGNIESLVKDALHIADPIASMAMDYEDEVATIVKAVQSVQVECPQFVETLDPTTLAEYLEKAIDAGCGIETLLKAQLLILR